MEWRVSLVLIVVWVVAASSHESTTTATASTTDPYSIKDIVDFHKNSLIYGNGNKELERYRERVRILHNLLRSECPVQSVKRLRREITSDVDKTQLEVEKILYERMTRMLIECRRLKMSTAVPTTSTTTPTTTTVEPQPAECQSATNLTEHWRTDHLGRRIKPINGANNCDARTMISAGRPWFRFTQAAGNQMLDACPPNYSCGSNAAFWTDAAMPSVVGTVANVTVYGSWSNNCRYASKSLSVMKCSDKDNDLVYRYNGSVWCDTSFCGMHA